MPTLLLIPMGAQRVAAAAAMLPRHVTSLATRWTQALLVLAWTFCLPGAVGAEPPARVGRLVEAPPGVWLLDRDSDRWLGMPEQLLANWPLTTGDRLRTDPGARAELRIGSVTLRLDGAAELTLQQLDDQRIVFWLQRGSAAMRLADGSRADEVELQTSEGRWLPLRTGHYRFDRQSDATQASVWRGELRFEGRDSSLTIAEGRRADIWLAAPGAVTHYAWATIDRDGFADWVAADERRDEPVAARYVSPEMTGWQDLDRYGEWFDDAERGAVWLPRDVPPGWAPYREGRWAWVAPWGWTWVDAAPWGFAPFHYGAWLQWRGRWAWSPGPRHQRPVFTPVPRGWAVAPPTGAPHRHRPPPPVTLLPAPLPGWQERGHDHAGGRPPPAVVVRPPPPPAGRAFPVPPQREEGPRDDGRDRPRDGRWDGWPATRVPSTPEGRRDGRGDGWPGRSEGRREGGIADPARERERAPEVPDKRLPQRPWEQQRTPAPAASPVAPIAAPAVPAPPGPRAEPGSRGERPDRALPAVPRAERGAKGDNPDRGEPGDAARNRDPRNWR